MPQPNTFRSITQAKEYLASTKFKNYTVTEYTVDHDGTMFCHSRTIGKDDLLAEFDLFAGINDALMCDSALYVISVSTGRVICICDMKNTAAGGYLFPFSFASGQVSGTK